MSFFEDNGGFVIQLFIIVFFGFIYKSAPKAEFAFDGFLDSFYFATTVTSTVGFGDFSPKNQGWKFMVMLQMFLSMLAWGGIMKQLFFREKTRRYAQARRSAKPHRVRCR